MSALARYFNFIGKKVSGYDKTPTPLTRELESVGITVHYEDDVDLIEEAYKNPKTTLVVYTPAVPSSHLEYNYFKDQGFQIKKRSEVLGLITEDTFCFAVAGTHGKTTTSCILAHLLRETGTLITAFCASDFARQLQPRAWHHPGQLCVDLILQRFLAESY